MTTCDTDDVNFSDDDDDNLIDEKEEGCDD